MMYFPPPQPILNKDIRVSGDVEIHPTASLAPGVILQAAPNGRIVIGADVCIGMGAIINACEETIEIGDGAILGSGVLIVGKCKIGNNSCIGTSTTIFQGNVAAMATIKPGSIVGDTSRQVKSDNSDRVLKDISIRDAKRVPVGLDGTASHIAEPSAHRTETKSAKSHFNGNSASTSRTDNAPQPDVTQNGHRDRVGSPSAHRDSAEIPLETTVESSVQNSKNPVVGQLYINELLVTLFPHKKTSNFDSGNLPK